MEKKPDFKAMSAKTKISYIWDYYRWHIIASIGTVALIVSVIVHFVTYKEPVLNIIMINCANPYNANSGFDAFLAEEGYENDPSLIALSSNLYFSDDSGPMSSMQAYQALAAMIAAGGQDLFFGTGEIFDAYADQGTFADLSVLLPEDLLDTCADSLIYSTNDGTTEAYPCAIEITENKWLSENNYYYGTCRLGILAGYAHPETAVQFVRFLLAES